MKTAIVIVLLTIGASAQEKAWRVEYWSAVGAASGAAALDAWTSQADYARSSGMHETENAWLYGRRPGAVREWGTMSAEVALSAFVSWRLHKSHGWIRHLALLPLAIQIEEHSRGGIHNALH